MISPTGRIVRHFSTFLLFLFSLGTSWAGSVGYGPIPLYEHVDRFLARGGQEQLQRAWNLPKGISYNPLQFLSREELPHRSGSGRRSSDLDVLHALGMHVPGVDSIDKLSTRSSVYDCQPEAPTLIADKSSEIAISYSPSTPIYARLPVEFAVRKWAEVFESPVRIRICFSWGGQNLEILTLGATSSPFVAGGDSFDQLRKNTVYSPALASALQGADVLPDRNDSFHLSMVLNAKIKWHVDRHTRAPLEKYDLATTVLHELTHGLFFSGTIKANNALKSASFAEAVPGRFDRFMKVASVGVAGTCETGTDLYRAVTHSALRFVDDSSNANFGLYAPGRFESGSSTYHFNNETLKSDCATNGISKDDCSDLMTHQLEDGYTQRVIGETTLRVYRAMRGKGAGVGKGEKCDLPDIVPGSSAAASSGGSDGAPFVLPTWGIATVGVVAGIGAILVFGVVISSVSSRRSNIG